VKQCNNNKLIIIIIITVAIETAGSWSQQARAGAGDRKTHHCHHRGQQRNHLSVSEAVRGSAFSFLGTFPHE